MLNFSKVQRSRSIGKELERYNSRQTFKNVKYQDLIKFAKQQGIQINLRKSNKNTLINDIIRKRQFDQQKTQRKTSQEKSKNVVYERKTASGATIKTLNENLNLNQLSDEQKLDYFSRLNKLAKNDKQFVRLEIKQGNQIYYKKIEDLVKELGAYKDTLAEFFDLVNPRIITKIEVVQFPRERGACDTREHSNPITFISYSDNKKIKLQVRSLKSTNDNCLFMCYGKVCGLKGNRFKPDNMRKQLGLPLKTPIEPQMCEKIAPLFNCSYSVYRLNDEKLEVICESEIKLEKHLNVLLQGGHYYYIEEMPLDCCVPRQIQIQSQEFNSIAENVIELNQKDQEIPEQNYSNKVEYYQTLNDPTIEQIQDLINSTDKHILILGQGGVGKTYTIKALQNVQYTATTGVASHLIEGQTIHSLIKRKFKDSKNIIVVDEVSMMGSRLFDQLLDYNLETKKKRQTQKRYILVGDVLQLPPVNDKWFFQAIGYNKFARNCIKINLTQVKRQENIDQIQFLNNLRVGDVDRQYLKKLQNQQQVNADVIISGCNKQVDQINTESIKQLKQDVIEFKTRFKLPDNYDQNKQKKLIANLKKEYPDQRLCLNAKVMLLSNIDVQNGLCNGSIGKIININKDKIMVQFKNQMKEITYIWEDNGNSEKICWMPLTPCYAITVHKSQGQTFDSATIYTNDFFERGQAYVAFSRVRDLKNINILGQTDFTTKAFKPNTEALRFALYDECVPADELLLLRDTEKQLTGIKKKKWNDPQQNWNHIYLDFETYNKRCEEQYVKQTPYYNKILHIKGDKKETEQIYFDQLWDQGQRCDVGKETWNYIKQVMTKYGNNLTKLNKQNTVDSKKIIKSEKKLVPTIVAYNGSGFDFNFIMKKFLNDNDCTQRFKINCIYKGSSIVVLFVYDKKCGEIVLKTHDMFQILGCSLKKALTDFCSNSEQAMDIAKKIEFKDEILYIMNYYQSNPNILKPEIMSDIKKIEYKQNGACILDLEKKVCLYDEVIKYANNDVDVLPILYRCVDNLCRETLNANITQFTTAGNMSWYGFISNLPDEAKIIERYSDSNRNQKDKTHINTKLQKLEIKELELVKRSIKGGRVCPRQFRPEKGQKFNYLDISGMYASIMRNEIFPFGYARYMNKEEVQKIMQQIKSYKRDETKSWRYIYDQLTKHYGLFFAEVDFEENPYNLEPVIQYKQDGKTVYSNQRRTDVLTSIDIALIIQSGGQIHEIKQVLKYSEHCKLMSNWIEKTLKLKEEGQRTNNSGLKAFGKLMANSSYGQTLKGDKNERIQFINNYDDAVEFQKECKITNFFEQEGYDVYIGKKNVDVYEFKTSRCQQIGAFVLAYTRGMIYEICEVAMPNRYNEKGIFEQPLYGDTDSLTFRYWQTELLIKAGWVKFENGKLTDELGEKSHWFCPKRLENIKDEKISFEMQQEKIWQLATEEEKRNPENFKMYYFEEAIFSAPKSYAVKYKNYEGTKEFTKIKFKGIPTTALIGDATIDFDIVEKAYTNRQEKYVAVLQSKPQLIKNFTRKEGKDAFLEIVDSNWRRDKFVSRQLFKTEWQGRQRLEQDSNITVPCGWVRCVKQEI